MLSLARFPSDDTIRNFFLRFSDITYVRTGESWLYMAEHMESALVERFLKQALRQRRPASGCLHHSDCGGQYASADYRRRLATRGLTASMSRAGICYDNAAMESFCARLRTELMHRHYFATRQQAHLEIFEYVEIFFDQVRAPQRPRLQISRHSQNRTLWG